MFTKSKKIVKTRVFNSSVLLWMGLSLYIYADNFKPNFHSSLYSDLCIEVPFGTPVGNNNGIVAYSNCHDSYISEEVNYFQGVYSGIKGQCVEYARRWFQGVKGLTFKQIDAAFQIWDLSVVTSLTDDANRWFFQSMLNGGETPPGVGDLLIYEYFLPSFPFGHVGVVVGVNTIEGCIDIAEQNYTNGGWVNPNSYARRIKLIVNDGHYTVIDKDFNKSDNKSAGGTIIGWKKVIYTSNSRNSLGIAAKKPF